MISAEQLQRFSRECLLLRKAIQEGHLLPVLDYQILKSNPRMLLTEIEKGRIDLRPGEKPNVERFEP